MAGILTLIAAVLAMAAAALATRAAYWARQACNTARELTAMPSPVIRFPGTLAPEAEAKLRAGLSERIEWPSRGGREPW